MDFESLPMEMKSQIFSNLSLDDLRLKVANVSKEWQTLSRDPFLVKHVDIYKQLDPKEIIHRLVTCNFARSLKITEIVDFNWILDIPVNHKIRRIHFDRCGFEIESLQILLNRFPMISHLKVAYCEYVWTATSIPSDLDRELNSKFLQLFAENCKNLEEVEIATYDSVDETSCEILLNLNRKTLTKVDLGPKALITDKNFATLAQCSRITDLHLNFLVEMTDSQLLCIKELRSLRKLSITEATNVSSNAFSELFTEPTFPHLYSINLRNCYQLSDDVITLISKSYPNLKSLNLSQCERITNVGVKSILENCSVLENLNLSRNDTLTGYILKIITTLGVPHLKYLNICRCKRIVFKPYREILKTSNPGLRVIRT